MRSYQIHRHMWFVEQQSGHKWCHYCKVHAPESQGKCVEKDTINVRVNVTARPVMVNAIAGPRQFQREASDEHWRLG